MALHTRRPAGQRSAWAVPLPFACFSGVRACTAAGSSGRMFPVGSKPKKASSALHVRAPHGGGGERLGVGVREVKCEWV